MVGAPSWEEIAVTLRTRVEHGTYPAGKLLPSTSALAREFGVSTGPIQRAVGRLKALGLVDGEPGRGVRVASAGESQQPAKHTLAERVTELEGRLADLTKQVEQQQADAELRQVLGEVQAALIQLYAELGRTYPGRTGRRTGRQAANT